MATLEEQYMSLMKEYARQFAAIIGEDFDCWIGPVLGQLGIFGDMSFTAEQIMFVVDNIDDFVKRYGSRMAVGYQVREWYAYITDDGTPQRLKSISLFTWLRAEHSNQSETE